MVALTGCASSAKVDRPSSAASTSPSTITTTSVDVTDTTTPTAPTTDVFDIPSEAIEPTLQPEDKVHVNFHFTALARGDIVIFWKPPNDYSPSIMYLIKRIVGLPGETISASDGGVDINGQPLKEP
jgi:signal peptidase I